MFFILSPAKNLNETAAAPTKEHSQPTLLEQSAILMAQLRELAPQDLSALMGVSDKIARLNAERNAAWQPPFSLQNAKQAVYLFNGDVYEGLDAESLAPQQIDWLQGHAGLLSGLYGLLRPLDLIQPYRLEMGTKLTNPRGKDLYAFWGGLITELLAERMPDYPGVSRREKRPLQNHQFLRQTRPRPDAALCRRTCPHRAGAAAGFQQRGLRLLCGGFFGKRMGVPTRRTVIRGRP